MAKSYIEGNIFWNLSNEEDVQFFGVLSITVGLDVLECWEIHVVLA